MKILLTSLLFVLSICFALAQVSIEPECLLLEGTDVEKIEIDIDITNSGSEETLAFWTFEPASDFPLDWKFQICDTKLCYDWDIDTSSILSTFLFNTIAPGETVKFTLKAQNIANTEDDTYPISGSSFGILRLFDNMDFVDYMAESKSCSVSTDNLELNENLIVFPNPTSDVFQLKNDENISMVRIYNIVGREITALSHTEGKAHDVSNLRMGMYLIRLEKEDGSVVKTMRLSKK